MSGGSNPEISAQKLGVALGVEVDDGSQVVFPLPLGIDGNLASGHPSVLLTGAAYAYNSSSVTGTPRHLLSN